MSDTVFPFSFSRFVGCMSVAIASCCLHGVVPCASAAEPLQYNRDVRPILAEYCFACHGADSAAREADLRLDQRDAAIEFGAITAGAPDESELIARVFSDDPDLIMPPAETKKAISAEDRETLRRWIEEGAEYQRHWSFLAPEQPTPPQVSNSSWAKNDIDRFVLATLEQHNLTPAAEANPATLFRRLHLDITGLPPKSDDIDAFAKDYADGGDTALSRWIDKLMDTPAWGEHRARYWLDAARYGDTHGLHFDNYREMWPYRDWVIRAFNANQPFDQFSVEQIAGDLLPSPSDDQLMATGFQRCNITTNEGGTIDEENLAIYASDRVQTFGWVYLGLTTNCSQCHDHKFDPFTMKDYYSLAAFFRNTTQPAKDGNVKDGRSSVLVVPKDSDKVRWKALPEEITSATAARDERRKAARSDFDSWIASGAAESVNDLVPSEQLLLHLPLTEGMGNEVAGNCGPVLASGDVNWIDDGKLGPAPVIKRGATFDAGDVANFEHNQGFSYGAWVKPVDNATTAAIMARMDESAAFRGWDLWQNTRKYAVHIIDAWPGSAIKVSTKRNTVKPGQWQHVFATYDGSGEAAGVQIYIDGQRQKLEAEFDKLADDASIRSETPLKIGQRSKKAIFEGGAVQDIRIYDRTLARAEVHAIATLGPMQSIGDKERTPQQMTALYEHFLESHDEQFPALAKSVTDLESERKAIRERSAITHIQEEKKDSAAMTHILMRGAYDKPGDEVLAAPPAALHAMPEGAPGNRLGLAQWLIDPANPLTARVTVNRFWQQLFGQGIVTTSEDFGIMGMLPSHPELLDWLAVDFRDNGWDVKRFFKQVLMSATYRQAAVITPDKLQADRDNVLLSRGPRFRMDAEMVRDYALASSGLLVSTMYGPSVKPYQPEKIWDMVGLPNGDTRIYVQDKGDNIYRRSLYTFWKRMAPPPNLETFNAPSREVCTVRRERTNTPLQALVTLNDPQFVEAARHLAQETLASANDDSDVLAQITTRVLCRSLSQQETELVLSTKRDLLTHYQSQPEDAAALIAVGDTPASDQLDPAELATWTMVCNQLMNLDETLNK